MSTVSEWSPYTQGIQSGVDEGFRYASGHFMLLAAGPPRITNLGGAAALALAASRGSVIDQMALPIGLIQNVSLSSSMSLARFFELGSDRVYCVPGRTVPNLSLSRPIIHGPSLLRMLWAVYQDRLPPTVIASLFANISAGTLPNPHDVKVPPGYENIYLNLASDFFKSPMGLLMMMRDSNEQLLAANYAEACYAVSHGFSVDANGLVMSEQVALQPERIVPVAAAVVAQYSGVEDRLAA